MKPIISCDRCEGEVHNEDVRKTHDCIYYCHNCYNEVNRLPEKSKAQVERWLIGNVL